MKTGFMGLHELVTPWTNTHLIKNQLVLTLDTASKSNSSSCPEGIIYKSYACMHAHNGGGGHPTVPQFLLLALGATRPHLGYKVSAPRVQFMRKAIIMLRDSSFSSHKPFTS